VIFDIVVELSSFIHSFTFLIKKNRWYSQRRCFNSYTGKCPLEQ